MMSVISEALLAVSSSLAASIAVKATLVMALALTGVWLARRSRAAVRHALLAAAFGVLLALPVASLVAPPIHIAVLDAAQQRTVPAFAAGSAVEPVAPPRATVGVTQTVPRSGGLSLSTLLLTAWIAGTALFLLPVAMGLWQVRSLRRSALPWRHGQPVVEKLALEAGIRRCVEVLLHESLAGPMTCGIVRPAIVLSPDAQTWQGEDLARAIVHELEHVRRGDWLSLCLARIVCAAYWFHPLVWMAWRQLALEAERACDDAVLGRSEPTAYADQLVSLARRLLVAKSPVLAMANRADLAARVGAVLDSRQTRGRAGTLQVALACAAASAFVVGMSPLVVVAAPQSASAQSAPQGSPAAATPQFDAASVKLVDSNVKGSHSSQHSNPKRLTMTGTMHRFIIQAYGITNGQLGGEPDWFRTNLYSIEAVSPVPAGTDQKMLMLRGLLADRFRLKLRQEDRDLPIYALDVAPGGPKFKELKPGEDTPDGTAPSGFVARSFGSIGELMNALNGGGSLTQDRPVVDRTHLTGDYGIQLVTEIEAQTDGFGVRTVQFPNLFHDMQSQLGLKVVPDHIRMPYFVVEQAARPTAN
jgi:uncharacterized protein (TIGR03435 family)